MTEASLLQHSNPPNFFHGNFFKFFFCSYIGIWTEEGKLTEWQSMLKHKKGTGKLHIKIYGLDVHGPN